MLVDNSKGEYGKWVSMSEIPFVAVFDSERGKSL